MLAEAGEACRLQEAQIFRLFIGPVFFIAIRLRICGGGSAPHFAVNAVLKPLYRHYRIYCTIVQNLIARLRLSNTRQVLHFCMWKFVWADKSHLALSAQTNFHPYKSAIRTEY